MSRSSSLTYRPPIFVRGLYALHAVPKEPGIPGITLYRENMSLAIAARKVLVKQDLYAGFVLQHAPDRVDCYSRLGVLMPPEEATRATMLQLASPAPPWAVGEALAAIAHVLKNPSRLASLEHHIDASAASRGNFWSVLQMLIHDADSDLERKQVCLVESYDHPCRMIAVAVDMQAAPASMQDRFLDVFGVLKKGLPLKPVHHQMELTRTLSGIRYGDLTKWLMDIIRPADRHKWELTLAMLPTQRREQLAGEFVRLAYGKLLLTPAGETIDATAADVLRDPIESMFNQFVRLPIS